MEKTNTSHRDETLEKLFETIAILHGQVQELKNENELLEKQLLYAINKDKR